jgi:hypothetical protein
MGRGSSRRGTQACSGPATLGPAPGTTDARCPTSRTRHPARAARGDLAPLTQCVSRGRRCAVRLVSSGLSRRALLGAARPRAPHRRGERRHRARSRHARPRDPLCARRQSVRSVAAGRSGRIATTRAHSRRRAWCGTLSCTCSRMLASTWRCSVSIRAPRRAGSTASRSRDLHRLAIRRRVSRGPGCCASAGGGTGSSRGTKGRGTSAGSRQLLCAETRRSGGTGNGIASGNGIVGGKR